MKTFPTIPLLLLSAVAVLLVGAVKATAEVATGAKAPAFTLKDTTGQEHSLSDFAGKTVVLEWTNADCPFVKKFYNNGDMQKMQEQLTGEDVVWLQIVSSAPGKQGHVTAEQGEKLRQDKNVKSTAKLLDPDGAVGKAYGAKTTPHMFVVDKEGVVVYQGAIDDKASTSSSDIAGANNYVLTAFEEIKAGKPVSNGTTKPYGCSVKY